MTLRDDTLLTHLGRAPAHHAGTVNTPVYRSSTFIWPDTSTLKNHLRDADDPHYRGHIYGRNGNPTTTAFEDAVAQLEGGFRGLIMPSGLAAIVGAVLAVARAGDHLLVTDNCYWHARQVFDQILPRYGIQATYFAPMLGEDIAGLIQPNTRLVYAEAPGSSTFEVQDIPALARVAHAHGALLMLDNTWATPLFFKAFEHGVDISIHAATKYLVGHSDAMLGVIVTSEALYAGVRETVRQLGYIASADDAYLGLRGLRTLGVRLRQHERSALAVARWLQQRPEVAEVLHPALPGTVGHETFKRDFLGSTGLFGVVLEPFPESSVNRFLESLQLFAMGASWGGFESLIRTQQRHPSAQIAPGVLLRLHVGLEAVEDLIADLQQGLQHLTVTPPARNLP
ncbi:cystathionine beta-lyase [Pseudomonas poae]|uniref:Cystathionine beta-lyase n=1 Tax=Pseudomonas poae TaxID=200451 RepID=A0A2S9ETA8_9PSED|nr:cystathionine beta-lyase [Pseudomonas poae]PRA27901.1 cystathionine beta-lyase [Pseudomonas poae]PRC19005.1 cystathionine beta-lyase [Pseudomonas poae]